MSSSASAGAAASAAAISAAAAARAREEHKQACVITMPHYDAKAASVEEMRAYSGCVGLVYPNRTEGDTMFAKVWVASVMICAVIGIVVGATGDPYDRFMSGLIGGFGGALVAGAGGLIVALVIAGVQFLAG